jgi:hypothetical protein
MSNGMKRPNRSVALRGRAEDSQGARPRCTAKSTRPRRRSHRVSNATAARVFVAISVIAIVASGAVVGDAALRALCIGFCIGACIVSTIVFDPTIFSHLCGWCHVRRFRRLPTDELAPRPKSAAVGSLALQVSHGTQPRLTAGLFFWAGRNSVRSLHIVRVVAL